MFDRDQRLGLLRLALLLTTTLVLLAPFGCGAKRGPSTIAELAEFEPGTKIESGVASWYGHPFHGRRTANGEVYDMHLLTAAHQHLPFGTVLQVVNRDNGRSVEVRVNDRGPFAKGRILDLSKAGAEALGMIGPGTARVDLYLVSPPPPDDRVYLVQAGAFRSRGKAESLQGRIQDEFPQLDVRVNSEDGWHRVHIGRYDVRSQAAELVRQLKRAGVEAWVVAVAP